MKGMLWSICAYLGRYIASSKLPTIASPRGSLLRSCISYIDLIDPIASGCNSRLSGSAGTCAFSTPSAPTTTLVPQRHRNNSSYIEFAIRMIRIGTNENKICQIISFIHIPRPLTYLILHTPLLPAPRLLLMPLPLPISTNPLHTLDAR